MRLKTSLGARSAPCSRPRRPPAPFPHTALGAAHTHREVLRSLRRRCAQSPLQRDRGVTGVRDTRVRHSLPALALGPHGGQLLRGRGQLGS